MREVVRSQHLTRVNAPSALQEELAGGLEDDVPPGPTGGGASGRHRGFVLGDGDDGDEEGQPSPHEPPAGRQRTDGAASHEQFMQFLEGMSKVSPALQPMVLSMYTVS